MIGRLLEFLIVRILARLFPSRYRVIPRKEDGTPMLRQFKICRWAYLQSFLCGEARHAFHRHRWRSMRSLVLSGWFLEERFPGNLFIHHAAPSTYGMIWTDIHRIESVGERTWTLFFMFDDRREWGYYERVSVPYTPWDAVIPNDRRVKTL